MNESGQQLRTSESTNAGHEATVDHRGAGQGKKPMSCWCCGEIHYVSQRFAHRSRHTESTGRPALDDRRHGDGRSHSRDNPSPLSSHYPMPAGWHPMALLWRPRPGLRGQGPEKILPTHLTAPASSLLFPLPNLALSRANHGRLARTRPGLSGPPVPLGLEDRNSICLGTSIFYGHFFLNVAWRCCHG